MDTHENVLYKFDENQEHCPHYEAFYNSKMEFTGHMCTANKYQLSEDGFDGLVKDLERLVDAALCSGNSFTLIDIEKAIKIAETNVIQKYEEMK